MKQQHILKYCISTLFLFVLFFMNAQEKKDSLGYKQSYGLRLGIDISRPLIQTIQKEDLGIELTGDYRVAKDWYAAVELGYESEPVEEDYLKFQTKGSYFKVGFNYNAYENWQGMNNEVYFGMRYGFSSFSQELQEVTVLDLDNYFGTQVESPNALYEGLNAHWLEIHFGLKVALFNNLFLTTSIQFKKLLSEQEPDGFANLYIPGFQRVYLNKGGIGFNYTIAYLIPFKNK